MKYMKERTVFSGEYIQCKKTRNKISLSYPNDIPDEIITKLHDYYSNIFADIPEKLKVLDVVDLIGYRRATILDWCSKRYFEHAHLYRNLNYIIPKEDIADFLCSRRAQRIVSKSKWHIEAIYVFENQCQK